MRSSGLVLYTRAQLDELKLEATDSIALKADYGPESSVIWHAFERGEWQISRSIASSLLEHVTATAPGLTELKPGASIAVPVKDPNHEVVGVLAAARKGDKPYEPHNADALLSQSAVIRELMATRQFVLKDVHSSGAARDQVSKLVTEFLKKLKSQQEPNAALEAFAKLVLCTCGALSVCVWSFPRTRELEWDRRTSVAVVARDVDLRDQTAMDVFVPRPTGRTMQIIQAIKPQPCYIKDVARDAGRNHDLIARVPRKRCGPLIGVPFGSSIASRPEGVLWVWLDALKQQPDDESGLETVRRYADAVGVILQLLRSVDAEMIGSAT